MNLNKQDFAVAILAVGMAEGINEVDKAATAIAGHFFTGSKEEQLEFLHQATDAADKAIAMFQQTKENLVAELASVEGAQQ